MDNALKLRVETDGPWHIAVIDYGITHGVMRLALHHGDFPRHLELVCGGATYFSGDLNGGPHSLRLSAERTEGGEVIELGTETGTFLLRCSRISQGPGRS